MRRATPQSFGFTGPHNRRVGRQKPGSPDPQPRAHQPRAHDPRTSERASAAVTEPYNWPSHGSETIGPFNPVARTRSKTERRKKREVSDLWRLPSSILPGVLRYPGNAMANREEVWTQRLPLTSLIFPLPSRNATGRPMPDTVSRGAEVSVGVETGSTDRTSHKPRAHEGASPTSNEPTSNEQPIRRDRRRRVELQERRRRRSPRGTQGSGKEVPQRATSNEERAASQPAPNL